MKQASIYIQGLISNEEFANVFREIYPDMQKRYPAQPFDHVTECLDCMWNMHHPMAIASSRRKASEVEVAVDVV